MMRIDQEIHNVFQYFKSKDIRWHDFHEVGIEEDYYDYYYAESRLYVIRDRCMSKYYFVKAGSPAEALSKFNGHVEDIASAMSNVDEDEPVGNSEQLEYSPITPVKEASKDWIPLVVDEDMISRCELFNKLAVISAPPEANEYKAEVYKVINGM